MISAAPVYRAGAIFKQQIMPKKIHVDKNIVKSLHDTGLGARKIAIELGLTREIIRRVFKELNIKYPKQEKTNIDTILKRVNKLPNNGCWEWQGHKNNDGYGLVTFEGKHQGVHRLVYKLMKGYVPPGLYVCHKCDNPICCNPDHLFIGTPTDNQIDCEIKNRHPRSKIDFAKALEIRRLFNSGISKKEISTQFNLSLPQICRIMKGECWAEVNYTNTSNLAGG